MHVHVHVRDPL